MVEHDGSTYVRPASTTTFFAQPFHTCAVCAGEDDVHFEDSTLHGRADGRARRLDLHRAFFVLRIALRIDIVVPDVYN